MTTAPNTGELGRYRPYPEYKDSGLEWLGEIPTHWDVLRLKAIADVRLSNVDKKSFEEQEAVRLCNYTDVYYNGTITSEIEFMPATATTEQIRRFSLQPGDVVITKDSESWDDIAVPAVVVEELDNVLCGYHLALIRPNTGVDGRFLARSFSAIGLQDQFQIAANGITRYGLSGGTISSASFSIPPHLEQQAIADFLDRKTAAIDALIARKERLIELLQEKRAALITQAVTKGLDPAVPMKESGVEWLGRIPAHWEVSRSKWLFTVRNERARPGDKQLSATQAYGVISQDEFMQRERRRVVQITQHLDKRRHVEIGDFVISMRSFQGGLERAWETGCIRSSYVVLQPSSQINIDFFAYLLKSDRYIQALRSTSNFIRDGQDLNFSNFSLVDLPALSLREQEAIAEYLDEMVENIGEVSEMLNRAIGLLNEYRTALISAAVTGKIDVRQEGE